MTTTLRSGLPLLFLVVCGQLLAHVVVAAAAQGEVYGFGGFVKASADLMRSAEDRKLDYSLIKVELLTEPGGIVKDVAECAPNGYYFLPIYDKGTFRLRIRGPEGWHFAPESILVDDTTSEDVNFEFTGFTLSGKVVGSRNKESCASEDVGPEGVTITLVDKESGKELTTTTTAKGGSYIFENVFPGTYSLKASHPSWLFSLDETVVELEWDNVVVGKDFGIKGYGLTGSVMSKEDNQQGRPEPVAGVDFLLYSAANEKSVSVHCDPPTVRPPNDPRTPLCGAVSDEHGHFVFNGIPCGRYTVVPYYKSADTMFDLLPARQDVSVLQGDATLETPFHVSGFSVSGSVVDQEGKGIEGVSIIVNGKASAVTDKQGLFTLEKMKTGNYDIEAQKEHVFFETLRDYRVSPQSARLPAITATSYHLCGHITIDNLPSGLTPASHREVVLVATEGKEQRTSTDPSGHFCFKVQPGTYQVTPRLLPEEEKAGLLLSPPTRKVALNKAPVLDIGFGQALLTVTGVVRCIESPCDSSISIMLTSVDRPNYMMTTGLGVGITDYLGTTSNKETFAHFVFRDVFPGSYIIQVHREGWCWENETYKLDIKARDEDSKEMRKDSVGKLHYVTPDFSQSGYLLNIVSTHDVNFLYGSGDKERKSLDLTKGHNRICLQEPGVYKFTPNSCYRFEENVYTYDTASPRMLELVATHFRLDGAIQVELPADKQLPDKIEIQTTRATQGAPLAEEMIIATPENKPDNSNANNNKTNNVPIAHLFNYSLWVKLGEQLTFTPKPVKDLLFYPRSQATSITSFNECPSPVPTIQARLGKFISGSVTPKEHSQDVYIKVFSKRTGEEVGNTKTSSSGSYTIGPFYDDDEYRVEAERDGYRMVDKPGAFGNFVAHKLSEVNVEVLEIVDSKEVGLGGVLLSLSGDAFRNNSAANEEGKLTFRGLLAGKNYFLRPMLKEYVFEPTTQSFAIADGESKNLRFKAQRVAFSCYGSVKSLNGQPEKFVSVEAFGPNGEYEEAQTDVNGEFRLRGLVPGKKYSLNVKLAGSRLERAAPTAQQLEATNGDIRGISFIVFRSSKTTELTGEVIASPRLALPTITVELYGKNEDGKNQLLQSVPLGVSNFFTFHSLPKDQPGPLTIRLKSSLPSNLHNIEAEERTISSLSSSPSHVQLSFKATPRNLQEELLSGSSSFFGLLFVVAALLAIYHHKLVLEFGKAAWKGELSLSTVANMLWRASKQSGNGKQKSDADVQSSFLAPHLARHQAAGKSKGGSSRKKGKPSRA
ncbi:Nodal modulator 1 [Balamuthia mandrillaris]